MAKIRAFKGIPPPSFPSCHFKLHAYPPSTVQPKSGSWTGCSVRSSWCPKGLRLSTGHLRCTPTFYPLKLPADERSYAGQSANPLPHPSPARGRGEPLPSPPLAGESWREGCRHAPRGACNTARSGVTQRFKRSPPWRPLKRLSSARKQVKGENMKKFFSVVKLTHQTSGQLPDLGSIHEQAEPPYRTAADGCDSCPANIVPSMISVESRAVVMRRRGCVLHRFWSVSLHRRWRRATLAILRTVGGFRRFGFRSGMLAGIVTGSARAAHHRSAYTHHGGASHGLGRASTSQRQPGRNNQGE